MLSSGPGVLGSHQSTQPLFSQSPTVESRLEGLPKPWGTLSEILRHPNYRLDNAEAGLSRTDLDQEVSQRLLQEEPWSTSNSLVHSFPHADESNLSPAAMFLAAFSPSIQPTRLPDDEGETVAGYVLGPVIGYGGFSTIRRASSPSGGVVAIKVVKRSDLARQSDATLAKKRLDHETEVWSSLSHEHILPLFSVEHTPYADFFVTLLCPLGSLFDILKRDGTPALPHDDAGMMFRQVVRGVRYLHEVAGYVHRDIKLENVLVDEMGVCRVCDFGLTRKIGEFDNEDHGDHSGAIYRHRSTISHMRRQAKATLPARVSLRHGPRRHRTSTPVGDQALTPVHPAYAFQPGSLPYAAPELLSPQTSGKHNGAHPVQDMWALGCLLYALLTGRLPFSDPFEPRLTMKILHGVYDMPSGIGRGADRVLRGCLERDVRHRWTIAMVDEVAWDIGWGEVDKTSSVTHEDEFEFVDYPNRPSPTSRSESRSRSRACRNHNSPLDPVSSSRSNRSFSRASATTASSLSTRSSSRSVSRPPVTRLPLASECDDLGHSVSSPSTPLSSIARLETSGSALTSPRSFVERGRRLKKADAQSTSRFAPSLEVSTARSDFGREPNNAGDLYSGTDNLANTARWASALGLNTIAEVSTRLNGTPSPAADKLRAIQNQVGPQCSKRGESTPPAPSPWPRRSRARVKEDPPSFRLGESQGVSGVFLREPSATPIHIPRKNGTRSRSMGCEPDNATRRHF
ncbi:kinase-like protein [Gyrodon lividus]|nr:kinase-like protein [Gyrodon lividus]